MMGPFTTNLVDVGNDRIDATATKSGIALEDITSVGIKCKDGSDNENVWYLDSGDSK